MSAITATTATTATPATTNTTTTAAAAAANTSTLAPAFTVAPEATSYDNVVVSYRHCARQHESR